MEILYRKKVNQLVFVKDLDGWIVKYRSLY